MIAAGLFEVASPPPAAEARRPRILLVDDDPDVLSSLAPVLRAELRADVATASSRGAAQQLLQRQEFAMVIADVRLPDGRGTELLAWLKDARPGTVRVLISAFHDGLSDPAATEARPDLVLWKAARVEAIMGALRRSLERT